MTRIISLFKNQKEAQEAMNALDSSAIRDQKMRIIEEWTEVDGLHKSVMPVPNLDPFTTGIPVAKVSNFRDLGVSDEVEMFIKRNLQRGGTLLIVELENDDHVAQAKRILREQDGRIAGE